MRKNSPHSSSTSSRSSSGSTIRRRPAARIVEEQSQAQAPRAPLPIDNRDEMRRKQQTAQEVHENARYRRDPRLSAL
jgi:hypothetical protein